MSGLGRDESGVVAPHDQDEVIQGLQASLVARVTRHLLVVDFSQERGSWNSQRKISLIIFFLHILFSVSDPDQYGSALIWLFWIRIRIGNADPDSGAWKLTKNKK
jgi:hypothetical protein